MIQLGKQRVSVTLLISPPEDEFVNCMKNPRIVAYMSGVGVSVHDVQHLFKIVANENDEVDIDRFVDGCILVCASTQSVRLCGYCRTDIP